MTSDSDDNGVWRGRKKEIWVCFLLQSRPPSIQKIPPSPRSPSRPFCCPLPPTAHLPISTNEGEEGNNVRTGRTEREEEEDFKAFAPFLFIMIPADDDGARRRAATEAALPSKNAYLGHITLPI